MTEGKRKTKAGFFNSKYWRMSLVLITGLLLFGAPYATYILIDVLKVRFLISTLIGFGAIVLGLLLMWYLIRTKVIS